MYKIKKGDIVQVVKGKDKGKKGKVFSAAREGRILVEGVNLVKKHKRQTRQDQQGGIVSVEASISAANLMLVCKHCDSVTRAGFLILKDGTKTRICKKCKEPI